MFRYFLLCVCLFIYLSSHAQPAASSWKEAQQDYLTGRIHQDSTRYDSANYYFSKAEQYFYSTCTKDTLLAVLLHRQAKLDGVQGRLNEAQRLFELSLALWNETEGEDFPTVAQLFDDLGGIYLRRGQPEQTLPFVRKGMKIKQKTLDPMHPDLGMSYFNMGAVHGRLNQFNKAYDWYQKAAAVWENKLPPDHAHFVLLYNNFGQTYGEMGDFDLQESYLKKSLEIAKKAYGPRNPTTAVLHNNLGTHLDWKGDIIAARQYKETALEILSELFTNDHPLVASICNNLGENYKKTGDLGRAFSFFQRALNMRKRMFGEKHFQVGESMNSLAGYYHRIGEIDRAEESYKKAIEIMQAAQGESEEKLGFFLLNLGHLYLMQDDSKPALRHFASGVSILKRIFGDDHYFTANAHEAEGDAYMHLEQYDKARESYQKVLDIRRDFLGEYHHHVGWGYRNLGELAISEGKYIQGFNLYQQSLEAIARGWKATNNLANPGLDLMPVAQPVTEFLLAKGKGLLTGYEAYPDSVAWLEAAYQTFSLAVASIREQRIAFLDEESRRQLSSVYRPLFEKSIETAVLLYELSDDPVYAEAAFRFTEISKNTLLYQAIREFGARQFSGIPDSVINREQDLRIRLALYEKNVAEEKQSGEDADQKKIAKWQDQIFQLKIEWQETIRKLEKEYPQYYQLKYERILPELPVLQATLQQEATSLVEYFIGDSSIYGILVDGEGIHIHHFPRSHTFEDQLSAFGGLIQNSELIDQRGNDRELFRQFVRSSAYLYEELLSPLLSHTKMEKLLIIPDGTLGYLPFDVLLTEPVEDTQPGGAGYVGLPYLIKSYQVRYGYAASLLFDQVQPYSTGAPFVGFAPDYADSGFVASYRAFALAHHEENLHPGYLPGNQDEVRRINTLFSGRAFLGTDATEQRFKQEAADYQTIHLAMHAMVDEEMPVYSGFAFAQSPETDSLEDGFLYASELFNLKLGANLAVLSACQTGYGKWLPGEGVMSLARAFMYAGCPNIVMNLWQADDMSSKEIMIRFYAYLKEGMGKTEALRRAKLDFLAQTDRKHPHFWGGMVLIGDDESIEAGGSGYVQWGIAGVGLLLILAGIFYWFSRRR